MNSTRDVVVRDQSRGKAFPDKNLVKVPAWAVERGVMYALAYTVHEVGHFVFHRHGLSFRVLERSALAHWGIVNVEYGKTYANRFGTAYGHVLEQDGLVIRGQPW